jgi:nuclear pore complex protein Nup107
MDRTKGDVVHMRTMKRILQASLDEVRNAMYPVLEPDFLSRPSDEAEAISLANIRNHYLPECILAYNSVLHFAGYAITRTWLVKCMDLAQEVATNDTLTEAFVASSRMKELVSAFALSSQALLHANEQGNKTKRDEGLEIWQVKPQDVGLTKDS